MNRDQAKKLVLELKGWIGTIEGNVSGAPPLILMGPGHHLHPLSELHPDTRSFLVFLHENALELRELQQRYLPREFWEKYGNLELEETNLSPHVRLLLAHREQPLVCAALRMVSRGPQIDEERQYLSGALSVLATSMQAHVEDSDVETPSLPAPKLVALRQRLTPEALRLLQHLDSPAYLGELTVRNDGFSKGTLKRWLPKLGNLGLINFERDGSTKVWRLTELGRAVVSLGI